MIGQVIYKDGTTEPIFHCDEHANYCEVTTPSGKYAYQLAFYQVENGIKYTLPEFYYYNTEKHEWFRDESIKEFQINKEN